MAKNVGKTLLVDRILDICPNAAAVYDQHEIEIPEGFVIEIWGCEIMCTGFLDTGGVLEYFLSLDEDVITHSAARISDDVVFAGAFETLLVTTGGGMVVARDRAFFPHPFVTAKNRVNWIMYAATNWSVANASEAIFYRYRKASPQDVADLLLRRR